MTNRLKSRTASGLVAAAAIAGASIGVAVTSTAAQAASAGSVYQLPLTPPAGTINPLTTADVNAMFLVGLANAQLVIEDTSGQLAGNLASSWAASGKGLKWTFKLRPTAKFSNGNTVKPADVVSTFKSITGAKSTSPAKSSFTGILKSVSAGKGDSVVFTLAKPYSDFPYLLTGANTNILPAGFNAANWIKNPVGAGEFILKKYTPGQGATYVKNPNYWDASAVKLSGVQVHFFTSANAEVSAFQSGQIDQINPVDAGGSVLTAVKSTKHRTETAGYAKFDGIVFNTTQAPLNNVDVRQAIAWALNRRAIVNTIYGGDATIGNDIATFPNYAVQPKGIAQRSASTSEVNQLVQKSGLSKPISFQITTYTGEQPLAELIQQELDATGDFQVTLNVEQESQYYGGSNATTPWLNAPVTITDWADRLPAQFENLIYGTGSSWNASHYSNTKLDSLATQYEGTTATAQRQKIENQMASIEHNDVPVIIAAFQKNTLILSPKVQGNFVFGQNFDGGFDFRGISLK